MPWDSDRHAAWFTWEIDTGVHLTLRAEAIRKQATGIHARVSILQDGFTLAYDLFNVERERDRIHLINSAYGKLGEAEKQALDKGLFAAKVDDFCREFYARYIGMFDAEELGGDPGLGPPAFLLSPYVLKGAGTIMFGPPGMGKTLCSGTQTTS